jgi:hypothetical protein
MNGPGFIGWANRMLMAGYSVWLMLVAWPMARAAPRERGERKACG